MQPKLYHCGIRGKMSRNTLAKANEQRDWRIYADFAQVLIARARMLYANDDFGVQLDRDVYALDSTTIDLCLTLFPWAKFRQHKAAVKVHTLMDLRGSIPCFICVTDGKTHDVNILDEIVLESGALYIMDRGYLDFARLCMFLRKIFAPLSRGQKATSIIPASVIAQSTKAPGSAATRQYVLLAITRHRIIPRCCAASDISMPKRTQNSHS